MTVSTINPAIPIPGTPLDAVQIQENFAAAVFDINNIYALIAALAMQYQNVTTVTAGSTYQVQSTDQNIIIKKTVGSATNVQYTPGTKGRVFSIFDGKGDCATNNITITPTSGLINGASSFVINVNYSSQDILDDGTNLWVRG